MAIRTPEPRIPLEPEEYPLYKPPRRVGCSGLTIVTLLTLAAFAFLFWRVTPPLARAITDFPKTLPLVGSLFSGGATPSAIVEDTTPGASNFSTETAVALNSPVPVVGVATSTVQPTVAPTTTPTVEYAKIANTGGLGIKLRQQPNQTARYDTTLVEGTVVRIIGPNVTDTKDPKVIWRHVAVASNDNEGYILAKYLISSPPPTP